MTQSLRQTEGGFTLPELVMTLTLTSVMVGLIMFFTFSYWRYGYLQEADLDTLITRLNAGDYFREAIGSSSGMVTQNGIADNHVLNADPAIVSGLYWLPNHAIPGNKVATSGVTPIFYYRQLSKNSTGQYIMNGTQPYEDEYVAYLNGPTKELKIRALANAGAAGNRLKTSCPPGSVTAACPADKIIAKDIASIDLRFFSRTGNLIDYTSIVDPVTGAYIGPDYPAVEVVELTLNIVKKPIFQTANSTFNSTIIRVALRNS